MRTESESELESLLASKPEDDRRIWISPHLSMKDRVRARLLTYKRDVILNVERPTPTGNEWRFAVPIGKLYALDSSSYTLLDLAPRRSRSVDGMREDHYSVGRVIYGRHIRSEMLKVYSLTTQIPQLSRFMRVFALPAVEDEDWRKQSMTIRIPPNEDHLFRVDQSLSVEISNRKMRSINFGDGSLTIATAHYLTVLHRDGLNLPDAERRLFASIRLLELVADCGFERGMHSMTTDKKGRSELRYFAQWIVPRRTRISGDAIAVGSTLWAFLDKILPRWFPLYDALEHTINSLLRVRLYDTLPLEQRFLSACFGIEAVHKHDHPTKAYFQTRLRAVCTDARNKLVPLLAESDYQRITDTRNELVHFRSKPNARLLDTEEMIVVTYALEAILSQAILARAIDASDLMAARARFVSTQTQVIQAAKRAEALTS